jgi:hypothetical protein
MFIRRLRSIGLIAGEACLLLAAVIAGLFTRVGALTVVKGDVGGDDVGVDVIRIELQHRLQRRGRLGGGKSIDAAADKLVGVMTAK